MLRPASRVLTRSSCAAARRPQAWCPSTRRLLSTAPPAQKRRTWKGTAARWGLAAGAVYYYNTSSLFAAQPAQAVPTSPGAQDDVDADLPSLDELVEERRKYLDAQQRLDASKRAEQGAEGASPGAQALEDEADSQGAFNPETGEINWDCPCLGGMAHGPCGEQFRAAFSCFVYSTEEPKGMDCIDKFKGMQDCFREHPDIYGEELDEDDEGREGKDGADGKDGGVTAQNKAVAEDGAPGDEAGKPKNKVDVVSDHSEQKTSDKSTEAAPTPGGGAKDDSSPIRAAASDATEAKAQHKPGTTGESAA